MIYWAEIWRNKWLSHMCNQEKSIPGRTLNLLFRAGSLLSVCKKWQGSCCNSSEEDGLLAGFEMRLETGSRVPDYSSSLKGIVDRPTDLDFEVGNWVLIKARMTICRLRVIYMRIGVVWIRMRAVEISGQILKIDNKVSSICWWIGCGIWERRIQNDAKIFGLKNAKNEGATFDTKVRKTQGSRFEGKPRI